MRFDSDRDAETLQRLQHFPAGDERRPVGHHELEDNRRIERESCGSGIADEHSTVRHLLHLRGELRRGGVLQPKTHDPS
jgi:hypothetical protein